ncbi:MAG: HAD family phosphatase [Verrucomicrobiales bacterium]|nr:HAD family phosphatase [Verrucomicrobiales bacterium]
MKPFQAVIFDMDGVIVDSEPWHERAFREIFQELGYGDTHGIDFRAYIGRSDRALWLDFIERHDPPHPLEDLLRAKQTRLIEILRREQPIFEGLPELVDRLARHYPLAVASGSNHPVIDEVLAMKQLRRYFPVVVSTQDVGKSKPAPDVFLQAAKLLVTSPADCCVVEDSAAGVTAARAAGMAVIALTHSLPRSELAHATHVVDTYEEVEQLLLPA